MPGADIFAYLGFFGYLTGALICGAAAAWIYQAGDRERQDRTAALMAALFSGLWCVLAAASGPQSPVTGFVEAARNLAFIALIFRLFANDGRDESLKPTRALIFALAFVQLMQPVLLIVDQRFSVTPAITTLTFEISALLHLLVSIGALVLLHNLYAGAAVAARKILRWSTLALTMVWAFELNFFMIAYLMGEQSGLLLALRGVFISLAMAFLALGSNASGAGLQFRPSRAVTFQSLSLLVIGSYLLVMVLVTRSLVVLGGDFARVSQVVFLLAAIAAAALWMPSKRMRGWLRVTTIKHLFQHRYDYREEWLRFTRTIGRGTKAGASFHERAVKAVADITDSPAGLLLVPNEEAQLELEARWNWATLAVPAIAAEYELSGLLEQHCHILDLDEARNGIDHHGETEQVPNWLIEAEDAWALVPLVHFDRLVGVIVLARPRIERRLDWEDFDLLRVVGQQLASYLSEQSGQQALMEASRFDEFNRRIAFVMHDIKNLASQLSLLARNAEKHAENPEFRSDMLVTLRNSADKLNALLARLGRYGSGQSNTRREIDLVDLARQIAGRFKGGHQISLTRQESALIDADAEGLEQALIHLVQNAVDASDASSPVYLDVSNNGAQGQFDIVDAGSGMSPGFVRNGLFKPFVSSKQGGFGIGAFEAREMIKAMGGRVIVESREGVGTRFSIIFSLSHVTRGLAGEDIQSNEVA